MRQLAYIETILDLQPIPDADKIVKATVMGWELVVKKNEFNVGDLCCYCEIDSIFPELPCFEFLRSRKFRIRTIKLKGQISQGIAFPLSIIKEVEPSFDLSKVKVGMDLTDILKITKYDPEALLDVPQKQEKAHWLVRRLRQFKYKLFGKKYQRSGTFPSDVPKTDEIRVQKMATALEQCAGQPCYITSKLDGCSSTFVFYKGSGNWLAKLFNKNGTFLACSRNRIIFNSDKGGETNHHIYKVALRYDIENKLRRLNRNIALQSEVVGPKVQGNIYRLPDFDMFVFSGFDIDNKKYLGYEELVSICKELNLKMVPIIDDKAVIVNDIKYYVELSKRKSEFVPTQWNEGIVVRTLDTSLSFKSINPEYLLHQELQNTN